MIYNCLILVTQELEQRAAAGQSGAGVVDEEEMEDPPQEAASSSPAPNVTISPNQVDVMTSDIVLLAPILPVFTHEL